MDKKSLLNKIFDSLIVGLFFGAACGASLFGVFHLLDDSMSKYEFEPGDVKILEHRKLIRDDRLFILGTAQNIREEDINSITINVDLFLEGAFVQQCAAYIRGALKPQEKRNFEATCTGKEESMAQHDSYKVYVTGY